MMPHISLSLALYFLKWGCGTGLAGLFGYFWVFLFGEVLNLSTSQILLTAQSLCGKGAASRMQ